MKRRIEWLDFGKGFTIFFVLLVHAVEGIFKTGQFSQYNIFSELIMWMFCTFIMPCFFALSGFLYKSPKSIKNYFYIMEKKAISLLIPYIIFSFVYVFMQHLSSVNDLTPWSRLFTIYSAPIGYLWFLYALFFVFALVGLMDLLKLNEYVQLLIYFLLFILTQLIHLPNFLTGAFIWTICFYLGKIIKDNLTIFNKKHIFIIATIVMCIALVWQWSLGGDWYETNTLTYITFVSKIASIPMFFWIFMNFKRNRLFDYFDRYGKYSLIIYLIHAPAASSVRVLLMKIGISNYFILVSSK